MKLCEWDTHNQSFVEAGSVCQRPARRIIVGVAGPDHHVCVECSAWLPLRFSVKRMPRELQRTSRPTDYGA